MSIPVNPINLPIEASPAVAASFEDGSLAITIDRLSVRYALPVDSINSLKELIVRRGGRGPGYREVWALRDVTVSVAAGEVVGLIGPNGAGKSTLLKVIARVLHPTSGRVRVRGEVAPLLELGAGFNMNLTGRENIYLKSAMLGFTHANTKQRLERIVSFAGLERFINAPLRTYSSGMLARLAFSVATDVIPEILLIDEILTVGDADFQQRSSDRIRTFREQGATILIVAHGLSALSALCDRVIWIDGGQVQAVGAPSQVIRAYERTTQHGLILHAPSPLANTPIECDVRHDTQIFLGYPGGPASNPIRDATYLQFPVADICQATHPSRLDKRAPGALADYRLLAGMYSYEQATQLLGQKPTTIALIDEPIHYARALQQMLPTISGEIDLPPATLAEALDHPTLRAVFTNPQTQLWGGGDLQLAQLRLQACMVVGLADQAEEAYQLCAYSFGWCPQAFTPAITTGKIPVLSASVLAELADLNRDDQELYAFARTLTELRAQHVVQELLRRYGDANHHQALSLATSDLQELRERHYRKRFLQHYRPTTELRLTMGEAIAGAGWHYAQLNQPHGYVRWTGPGRDAWLDLPLASTSDLTLTVGLMMALQPNILSELELLINGIAVEYQSRPVSSGGVLVNARMPRSLLAMQPGMTRVGLRVPETLVPAELDPLSRDRRALGVAVMWVRVAPVLDASVREQ